jgi:hypothetical protein
MYGLGYETGRKECKKWEKSFNLMILILFAFRCVRKEKVVDGRQEVTSELMRELVQQRWARSYYVTDPSAARVNRYGNCMLSRYKFNGCVEKNLETQMGRKLMLGKLQLVFYFFF